MNYDTFLSTVNTMSKDGQFSFGINWTDYVKFRLNEDIINVHKSNLTTYYNSGLKNKSVLDIGCGSGLSSLCFNMLGCSSIHSIDVDENSVTATNLTREKFVHLQNSDCVWNEKKSILDSNFILQSKKYDVVYSWGVLHHTGDMWSAIKNTIKLVNPGGILHLALYTSGTRYNEDLKLKILYNAMDDDGKKRMIYNYLYYHFISKNVDIFSINSRGMNKYNDCIDWLGGIPYEVCNPDILDCFLTSNSFERIHFKKGNEGGNFIITYKLKS